ncbi:MAG: hypothetical protein QOE64_1088 [Frankiales bacterium]|nr:hypothetical protein [Frankiales bacterium]
MLALRPRSTRAAAFAAAVVVATPLIAGTAGAATATPAVGSAGSSITVLKVDAALASIRALTASLSSSTAANPDSASISVTPIWSSMTGGVGSVTVTPANSPKHVGAGTVALPSGLASLTGPAVDVVASATNGSAIAGVTGKALGTINVLGTPLSVGTGAINLSSQVTKSAATSSKQVSLSQLALPTLLDLLSGLGLDLSKLNVAQLNSLFNVVATTAGTSITALNSAVDTAQTNASSTADTVAAATAELVAKQGTATAAASTVATQLAVIDSNLAAINTALGSTVLTSPVSAVSWQAANLTGPQLAAIDVVLALVPANTVTTTTINAAITALNAANLAVNMAQALVTALVNLVTGVKNALDADPLATLGNISAGTSAAANTVGTASAHLTVGTVDVLGAALPQAAQLTSALASVTGAVASVLNSITGVTFTAPTISIGAITKTTDKVGKTASAAVTVAGLKIGLPTLTMPESLGLPNAAGLPGVSLDAVNNVLSSLAGTVTIAELTDNASFTQGSTATTTPGSGGGGSLPTTGAPAALGLAALAAIGLGMLLRRRTRSTIE